MNNGFFDNSNPPNAYDRKLGEVLRSMYQKFSEIMKLPVPFQSLFLSNNLPLEEILYDENIKDKIKNKEIKFLISSKPFNFVYVPSTKTLYSYNSFKDVIAGTSTAFFHHYSTFSDHQDPFIKRAYRDEFTLWTYFHFLYDKEFNKLIDELIEFSVVQENVSDKKNKILLTNRHNFADDFLDSLNFFENSGVFPLFLRDAWNKFVNFDTYGRHFYGFDLPLWDLYDFLKVALPNYYNINKVYGFRYLMTAQNPSKYWLMVVSDKNLTDFQNFYSLFSYDIDTFKDKVKSGDALVLFFLSDGHILPELIDLVNPHYLNSLYLLNPSYKDKYIAYNLKKSSEFSELIEENENLYEELYPDWVIDDFLMLSEIYESYASFLTQNKFYDLFNLKQWENETSKAFVRTILHREGVGDYLKPLFLDN